MQIDFSEYGRAANFQLPIEKQKKKQQRHNFGATFKSRATLKAYSPWGCCRKCNGNASDVAATIRAASVSAPDMTKPKTAIDYNCSDFLAKLIGDSLRDFSRLSNLSHVYPTDARPIRKITNLGK